MNSIKYIIVNLCRLLLALTFILSGYVKAVDPLGTQYKLQDYLTALSMGDILPDWMTLGTAVALAAIEFCLGIFLLFAIHRRMVSKLTLAFMLVMTALTVWIAATDPVQDCGCFGDALILTNTQTLLKNVVLLTAAVIVSRWPLLMLRFISKSNQWIVINYTILFIVFTSILCLYDLPIFDFRPYHIGADIHKGMEIPEGEQPPQFETTFILEKDGEQKEFTLENYPDSTWTFIDSKTVMTSKGYVPPIHDFVIERVDDGEDITEEVLSDPGYTFLLISPSLEKASDSDFGTIDQLYEYSQDHGYHFYCLTASGDDAISRWTDLTGAEYQFCHTDPITLKTIIRSNPGLLLLKNGIIIRKWSHNNLPVFDPGLMSTPLDQLDIGHQPDDSASRKVIEILLWFVLPLLLLTFADRIWTWKKNKNEKIKIQDKDLKIEKTLDSSTCQLFIN